MRARLAFASLALVVLAAPLAAAHEIVATPGVSVGPAYVGPVIFAAVHTVYPSDDGPCPVRTRTQGYDASAGAMTERASVFVGQRRTSEDCANVVTQETLVVARNARTGQPVVSLALTDAGGGAACLHAIGTLVAEPYACAPVPWRQPHVFDLLP